MSACHPARPSDAGRFAKVIALVVLSAIPVSWGAAAEDPPRDGKSKGTAEQVAPPAAGQPPVRSEATTPRSPGIVLKGRCVDDAGQPVAGADVHLFFLASEWASPALKAERKTDAGGEFEFAKLKPLAGDEGASERYVVAARKPTAVTVFRTVLPLEKSIENLSLVLDRNAATLTGVIFNDRGEPVEGAEVYGNYLSDPRRSGKPQGTPFDESEARATVLAGHPFPGFMYAVTDNAGRFAIHDVQRFGGFGKDQPAQEQYWYFAARHPAYPDAQGTTRRVPANLGPVMTAGGFLEGRVLEGPDGRPAVGALVTAAGDRSAETTTDEAGAYRLAVLPGRHIVRAGREDRTSVALAPIEVKVGEVVRAGDLTLISGGIIRGRVFDQATGQPVTLDTRGSPIGISNYGPSTPTLGFPSTTGIVADDGTYRIRVAPGENNPFVWNVGVDTERVRVKARGAPAITVAEGQTVELDFPVTVKEPQPAPQAPPAAPQRDPTKLRPTQRPAPRTRAEPDGPGAANVGLSAVRVSWDVSAEDPPRDGKSKGTAGQVAPPAARQPPERSEATVPRSPGIVLKGRCVDDAGQPLAGADVHLFFLVNELARPALKAEGKTNAAGEFEFARLKPLDGDEGASERYVVAARKASFVSIFRTVLPREKSVEDLSLVLDRNAGALSGVIRNERREPVEGAEVFGVYLSYPRTSGRPQGSPHNNDTESLSWRGYPLPGFMYSVTDKEGRFEINDIRRFGGARGEPARGEYWYFGMRHPDYVEVTTSTDRIPINLNLGLVLATGGFIEGRVLEGTTGQPAAGAQVFAMELQGQRRHAETTTDETGAYRLPLSAARYVVRAGTEGRTSVALPEIVVTTGESVRVADLTLIPGGVIRGRVFDQATGKPVTRDHRRFPMGIYNYGPATPILGFSSTTGVVADDGAYRIRVAPGENYPFVWNVGVATERASGQAKRAPAIVIAEGQTVELDFPVTVKEPPAAVPAAPQRPAPPPRRDTRPSK